MWRKLSSEKNKYLQSVVPINPIVINDIVMKNAYKPPKRVPKSKTPPVQTTTVSTPAKESLYKFDITRIHISYGSQGLPNILHRIGSSVPERVYIALRILIYKLQDPFEYYRGITKLEMVKRLEDCLFRHFPEGPKTAPIISLVIKSLEFVAKRSVGAEYMMKQFNLIDTIYELIINSSEAAEHCTKILAYLSKYRFVGEEMLFYNHLGKLKSVFISNSQSFMYVDIYEHLCNLILMNPTDAINYGFFEFLWEQVLNLQGISEKFSPIIMKCFALILDCCEGHSRIDDIDGINNLYHMLKLENLGNSTLEYITLAILNSTTTKKSVWRCREFWDLPLILIRRAYNKKNDNLQLYSILVLRQLTAMPSIKNFVRHICKKKILDIPCRNPVVEKSKIALIDWLEKKNYYNVCKETNQFAYKKIKPEPEYNYQYPYHTCSEEFEPK